MPQSLELGTATPFPPWAVGPWVLSPLKGQNLLSGIQPLTGADDFLTVDDLHQGWGSLTDWGGTPHAGENLPKVTQAGRDLHLSLASSP